MNSIKSVAIGIRNINTKSGLGKIVLEQVKYYLANNIKIDIYTSKYDQTIKETGVNIIKISRIPFLNEYYQRLFFAKSVQKRVKKNSYDLVIGHGDLIEQDVMYLHNLVEKAYFMTHKEVMSPLNNIAKIRRLILSKQNFKILVANSELMKNELIKTFNIPEAKIKVIYPGYDPLQFNTNNQDEIRKTSRNELGVDSNTLLIGFITSGDFKKRALNLFIEALSKIDVDVKYKVLLVGKDKSLPNYMQQAKEYGLDDKFIIREPIDSVEKYFHAVDFTVHPAHFEEFGMVVQEAMACGLAVITSEMVGASEIISERSLVMEKPNIDELTVLIKKLIIDAESRKTLSKISLECVKDTTWESYIKNSVKVAESVVSE